MSISSLKITTEQAEFIKMLTGTQTVEEAVEVIVVMMIEEDVPRSKLLQVIERCMDRYPRR